MGRFWVGRTYTFVEIQKGGIMWEETGGVDSGRVAHINWLKRGVQLPITSSG